MSDSTISNGHSREIPNRCLILKIICSLSFILKVNLTKIGEFDEDDVDKLTKKVGMS